MAFRPPCAWLTRASLFEWYRASRKIAHARIPWKHGLYMASSLPVRVQKPQNYVEFIPLVSPSKRCLQTSFCLLKMKANQGKKMEVIVNPVDVASFIDLEQVLEDMINVKEKLKNEYLHSFRIGANIKLLDQVMVSLEGDDFHLREIAKITKKSAKLLEVDFANFPEALSAAQTAIEKSEMNLNPSVKGTKLEISVPMVTAEHRKALVKAAKQKMNEAKDQVKKIRNNAEKKLSKIDNVPMDTALALRKQIGTYVNATSTELELIFTAKEKDLLLQ